ncbi:RNA methyltransferase [Zunongwangia sp. F260]|uniref:RNA methyltransferase n=1 Tax=Autumnicola lenta TaxID=3075593 RepID=A0ABU3CG84_9FLAO|nr:RNA methyltransferase [Zunongwangia sp. F260]MDT0645344.1 RNA methyltransferase [Zunongwangia sp. F260]
MVSKNQIKLIKSLGQKKNRRDSGLFVAEGKKTISELLTSGIEVHLLFSEERIFDAADDKFIEVGATELKKISLLKTPQTAVGIFKIPKIPLPDYSGLIIALGGLRDPGNLGTIVRLCDWFGIDKLVCSKDTVDCYNPKVIQATMGSIARIAISYVDLPFYLRNRPESCPVVGTFMEAENIYQTSLPHSGIIVMGNEANGISPEIEKHVTHKIGIPQFGKTASTESLNVATATAIILSEFKRG